MNSCHAHVVAFVNQNSYLNFAPHKFGVITHDFIIHGTQSLIVFFKLLHRRNNISEKCMKDAAFVTIKKWSMSKNFLVNLDLLNYYFDHYGMMRKYEWKLSKTNNFLDLLLIWPSISQVGCLKSRHYVRQISLYPVPGKCLLTHRF